MDEAQKRKLLDSMSDIEVVVELWKRRVEYLYSMSEYTPTYGTDKGVDYEWLDAQIAKEEAK